MSIVVTPTSQRSLVGRAWAALAAVWGIVLGVLPHVLHHVGPLAGAALLAGAGGTALFAVIGFVASISFLLRLHGASAHGSHQQSRPLSSQACSPSPRS